MTNFRLFWILSYALLATPTPLARIMSERGILVSSYVVVVEVATTLLFMTATVSILSVHYSRRNHHAVAGLVAIWVAVVVTYLAVGFGTPFRLVGCVSWLILMGVSWSADTAALPKKAASAQS